MRRGSINTYADDGRRHSAGMVSPDYRRSSGNNNRQEFTINDLDYETTGGCFVSYRQIAFAFVFMLAILIAAAFIGVYLGSPPDKDIIDSLAILSKDEDVPDKYILSPSIKPLIYRIELLPIPEEGKSRVKFEGRVIIEFVRNGTDSSPKQLVLNSKHLTFKSYRLVMLGGGGEEKSATSPEQKTNQQQAKRRKREDDSAVELINFGNANTTAHLMEVRTAEEPIFKTELKISDNKTDESGDAYVLFLESPLRNGNYSLELEYEATVDERVVFIKNFTKGNETRLLLASKLKPVNAPRLFPTFDETRLQASFVLTVLHQPETKVLSNMPLMNSSDSSTENLIADTFNETRSMSAHNLAFVTGKLEKLDEVITTYLPSQNIVYWGDAEHKYQDFYLLEKIASVANYYKRMFEGVPRATDKLDIAALPLDFDGLSSPGLIIFKESLFFAPVNSPSYTRAKALRNLIGLFGQQWLGCLVDAKNWTDAWYTEGATLFLQYSILDKMDHSLKEAGDFLVDVQLETMENDGYMLSKPLDSMVNHSRIEAFDLPDNYRKGACLISMLHAVLDVRTLRTGYANFLRRWSYRRADSDAFLHAIAGNETIEDGTSKIHLDEAFAGWTRQPGYPLVNVTWHRHNGTVVIRQAKFNFAELSNEDEDEEPPKSEVTVLWWIPLTYVTAEGTWSKSTFVWLKGKEEMTLENVGRNESWILFNVDRTGYYRVNYDEENWRSIAEALRNRHSDFPVATRASLIDDALSLARQGSIGYEIALGLLDYLGPSERDFAPWKAFARHALQLDFALYETAAYAKFLEFMRKHVSALFDGLEPKIDEGSSLVMLAVQLACLFEYQKCTSWAKDKWEDVFKNSTDNTIPKHVRETVYCIGAQRGGQEELSYLMEQHKESNDTEEKDRLLSAIGCFQIPWLLQKVLNEILEENKFEDHDVRVILESYAKNPAAAQVARRFVQEHWKEIVKRFSHSYWTMKAFVQASTSLLYTERDLNEFNRFRDENIESLKLMGHWVALNEMKAFSWVYRLKESYSSIQKYFRNHTAPSA